MTALEYMNRQIAKHKLNHDREFARGVPEQQLENIRKKIEYYTAAAEALLKEERSGENKKYVVVIDNFEDMEE